MELLKAEISRKRKANEELLGSIQTKIGSSKCFRQKDIQQIEEERRIEAQRLIDAQRNAASNVENNFNNISKTAQILKEKTSSNTSLDLSNLTLDQVKQRLRSFGEPVTLFGESERLATSIRSYCFVYLLTLNITSPAIACSV